MSTEDDDWYTIRPPTPSEIPFIAETTCRVLRPNSEPVVKWLRDKLPRFRDEPVSCAVADVGGPVCGFIAILGGAVRMLYVKRDFRGKRVGLRLAWAAGVDTEAPIQVVEETPSFNEWCKWHGFRWERKR